MTGGGNRKLLVIDVAALSFGVAHGDLHGGMIETVFPALTCPVQASFRTASFPDSHGVVANGFFRRDLRRAMFWEQSARLVSGRRIWGGFRAAGGKVAMLFWQQSLGEDADVILSPAPIHKHHGGMIEDCYSQPAGLYDRLCRTIGRRFKLRQYWGPMASAKVGRWIVEATLAVLTDPELAPGLCLTYLPTADYDLQRKDPSDPAVQSAVGAAVNDQLAQLIDGARSLGYEIVLFGDYRIAPVARAALPNLALAQAGLLKTRPVKDMLYPDLHTSRAFAMVDHQIAHVYAFGEDDAAEARAVLAELPGVAEVMDRQGQGL
ncbi:hypothetical protein LCGC14_2874320, partial [marine sediment metagenome]